MYTESLDTQSLILHLITSIRSQEARINEIQTLINEGVIDKNKRINIAQRLLRMRLTRKMLLLSLINVLANSRYKETYLVAMQLYCELTKGKK
jgi:hypothetical protein